MISSPPLHVRLETSFVPGAKDATFTGFVRTVQELVTLAPDVRQRVQDLRLCARGSLWRHEWYGTRDGGAFVSPLLLVVELDGRGRQRREVQPVSHGGKRRLQACLAGSGDH